MTVSQKSRPLTPAERNLAGSIFGDAIHFDPVRIHRRKWFPFQPCRTIMAPDGDIWIHPKSELWSDDFGAANLSLQALFLHELTHVWQAQNRGRYYLPLMRHPFCRYGYRLVPGRPFERYGLEQQAEIVRHAFLRRNLYPLSAAPSQDELEALLPFFNETL